METRPSNEASEVLYDLVPAFLSGQNTLLVWGPTHTAPLLLPWVCALCLSDPTKSLTSLPAFPAQMPPPPGSFPWPPGFPETAVSSVRTLSPLHIMKSVNVGVPPRLPMPSLHAPEDRERVFFMPEAESSWKTDPGSPLPLSSTATATLCWNTPSDGNSLPLRAACLPRGRENRNYGLLNPPCSGLWAQ